MADEVLKARKIRSTTVVANKELKERENVQKRNITIDLGYDLSIIRMLERDSVVFF